MHRYLFNTEKIKYVRGEKPRVPCILCAIRDNDPDVANLLVGRTALTLVTVNLYPFNPGHLLIFPERHVESLADLREDEAMDMHRVLVHAIEILREEFHPTGFNVGYNLGNGSGASIAHIHQQVVPRYENEVGFLDVLAGTRVQVIDPVAVMERLQKRFDPGKGA